MQALACPSCGAPVDVGIDVGRVRCDFCGTVAMLPAPSMVSEPERIERLRAQQGREEPPPAYMGPLMRGRLYEGRREQAEMMLARARAQPPSWERDTAVYWLTTLLYSAYGASRDARRQRALLCTALETLAGSPRRQVLLGMLARTAVRSGEWAAAEYWLGQMNPRPLVLFADSAYRLSRAYFDTAWGDYPAVLGVLGATPGPVPLAASDAVQCSVLRANAHERQGDPWTGAMQLTALMRRDPSARAGVETVIEANDTLALCPVALSWAVQGMAGAM